MQTPKFYDSRTKLYVTGFQHSILQVNGKKRSDAVPRNPVASLLYRDPPSDIHLKPAAKPKAKVKPIPTPFHIKEKHLAAINKAVDREIYKWVPPGEPTPWVHQQVVTSKKNGDIRLTIDLQYLINPPM